MDWRQEEAEHEGIDVCKRDVIVCIHGHDPQVRTVAPPERHDRKVRDGGGRKQAVQIRSRTYAVPSGGTKESGAQVPTLRQVVTLLGGAEPRTCSAARSHCTAHIPSASGHELVAAEGSRNCSSPSQSGT